MERAIWMLKPKERLHVGLAWGRRFRTHVTEHLLQDMQSLCALADVGGLQQDVAQFGGQGWLGQTVQPQHQSTRQLHHI